MKRNFLFVFLPFAMLFASMRLHAQTPDAELKALEAQLERIANTDLPDFAPELFISIETKVRELRSVFEVDYNLWKDIVSLGVLKIADKLIDWYAESCSTPPEIEQTFEVNLPQNINCDALEVRVVSDASLIICCFTL